MTAQQPFDADEYPALRKLVDSLIDTRQEQVISVHGRPVARVIPLGRKQRGTAVKRLVDTSTLAPVPDTALAGLLSRGPAAVRHGFTEQEIAAALELDRADAWRAKQE